MVNRLIDPSVKLLDIVVAQTHDYVLDMIESWVEKQRKNKNIPAYNNIHYTTEPNEVVLRAMEGKLDILIVGQYFYEPRFTKKDLDAMFEGKKPLPNIELPVYEEYLAEEQKEEKPTISRNNITRFVKEIKPDTWIFRYSTMPEKDTEDLIGDIPKPGLIESADEIDLPYKILENSRVDPTPRKITEFLNSPMLAIYYRNKDIEAMKERFPYIKFHV